MKGTSMHQGFYFEEFSLGDTFRTEGRTVTESDLVEFVTRHTYSEPLFMDREYIEKETQFEGPIAPALMTVSMADGLSILSGIIHKTGMAFLWMEMDVKAPVFIGDTIHVEIEVVEKRETQKPDRGIITFRHLVLNQKGELVMEYRVKRMIRRKK